MTLTEFVTARLDEDEAAANEVHLPRGCGSIDRDGDFDPDPVWCGCGYPARVLREVAAGRAILAEHRQWVFGGVTGCSVCDAGHEIGDPPPGPCPTLRALGAVYCDHPDYDPAWATGA